MFKLDKAESMCERVLAIAIESMYTLGSPMTS